MGLTLPLRRWGRGDQPLLLVHGFTGNAAAFDHLEPLLGDRACAAAVELPGHGAPPPTANGQTGWDATVDATAAAIERAHAGPAHLVGYSMGARLSIAVALRFPHLVRSLVLESGTAGIRGEAERAARLAHDEELASFLEREGIAAFVDRWEQTDVLATLLKLSAPDAAALRERRLAHDPRGLAWSLRQLGVAAQPDLWPELRRLAVPTLLVHGARDDKFRALAERMALRLPDATLREIRGAGHAPHLERRQRFADVVLEFLAAQQDAAERAGRQGPAPATDDRSTNAASAAQAEATTGSPP